MRFNKDWKELESYSMQWVDIEGNPVEKNKLEYPYSYDAFVLYDNRNGNKSTGGVYSDRLMQWDYNKFNRCCMEVWNNQGQYFNNRSPKDIEKFLSLYFGKQIEIIMIIEGCNVSNGYPYWYFDYKEI